MTYDAQTPQAGWTVHRVGQGILLAEGGKVLLSGNRWYNDKPLVWTLPGGRAEEGEGIQDALVREFREETGLLIEVGDLAYVAESRSEVRRQIFLVCTFVVRRLDGQLTCEEDPGVEELTFAPVDLLDKLMPSPTISDPLRWYLAHPEERARYWFFPEYISS